MKIHFDGVNTNSRSGPNSFAVRLARGLFEAGHEVVFEKQDAQVSLVFIEPTGQPLAPKVIQRLDGIWFKPWEFATKNGGIKHLYKHADAVIFQSQFDQGMTFQHFGAPGLWNQVGIGVVIGNGIDLNPLKQITIPKLVEMRAAYERIYVCSSNWHPQKRLEANVKLFARLREQTPNSCLIVLGDHPDYRATGPNVFYAGSVDHDTCAEIYSAADWMLHLAWADHCPNVVVEALAQGTPVVCCDVGGTKELVGQYGVVLKDQPYHYELYDYDNPPQLDLTQITSLPNRHDLDYTSIADIDIKSVTKQYIKLFERVMK